MATLELGILITANVKSDDIAEIVKHYLNKTLDEYNRSADYQGLWHFLQTVVSSMTKYFEK